MATGMAPAVVRRSSKPLIVERDGSDPERFLFKNCYANRETAKERMDDSFKALLKECHSEFDEFGSKRTIYSLRHTALMLRLLQGDNVDLLMLARNAGTSVDQLERFYFSHADPAMKVSNLQSYKPRRKLADIEKDEIGSPVVVACLSIRSSNSLLATAASSSDGRNSTPGS